MKFQISDVSDIVICIYFGFYLMHLKQMNNTIKPVSHKKQPLCYRDNNKQAVQPQKPTNKLWQQKATSLLQI